MAGSTVSEVWRTKSIEKKKEDLQCKASLEVGGLLSDSCEGSALFKDVRFTQLESILKKHGILEELLEKFGEATPEEMADYVEQRAEQNPVLKKEYEGLLQRLDADAREEALAEQDEMADKLVGYMEIMEGYADKYSILAEEEQQINRLSFVDGLITGAIVLVALFGVQGAKKNPKSF